MSHAGSVRGRSSITRRLTLLFASASIVVLLLLGTLIGRSVEQHFVEQDMEILTGRLDLTRHALEKVHASADLDSIPQQLDDSLVGHQGLAVAVVAHDGQTLFATRGAEFPRALLDRQGATGSQNPIVWYTSDGVPFRGLSAQVSTGVVGAPPAIVAVATEISHHQHFMDSFRLTLWAFVVLAALLMGFLGWVAVRRGLRPLQAIRRKTESITASRLDSRLDVEAVPEELLGLAESLNAMLSRLELSFQRLSDFSSDLAHEFRTPISNLMMQTQVTLSRTRSAEEYREVLASSIEEYERLSRMIADMLFLAKADHAQLVPRRERLDLAHEIADMLAYYDVLAEEKGIRLVVNGAGVVDGDRLMLQRAIGNLLSNAIRHTPAAGEVSVTISRLADERIEIAVQNTGETIPAEHLPRLFDRFYRADSARQRTTEGSGLGLAITRSIIVAHGGSVSVTSSDGITRFVIVLPLAVNPGADVSFD